MRPLTTDRERQICDVLESMGPAEFYDSLISGGTFAVGNMLACSDEEALGILADLQGRQIITIETTGSEVLAVNQSAPAAQQARFRRRCTIRRRGISNSRP